MSTRELILGQVRDAVSGISEFKVNRQYAIESSLTRNEVVDLFAERVADYKAEVIRCNFADASSLMAEGLSDFKPDEVLLGRGIDQAWAISGTEDADFSPLQLDGFRAVVTTSAVSIAETGTIVLDHRPDGQGRRALSLVPDRHVCIVLASQIVHTVPEAIALLDPRRNQTWISGPSATSDIELNRVEGVHGPRDLRVIIVTDR